MTYNITEDDIEYLKEDLNNLENASTREEILDALYDLRDDLTGNYEQDDDSDDDGGHAYILRK